MKQLLQVKSGPGLARSKAEVAEIVTEKRVSRSREIEKLVELCPE